MTINKLVQRVHLDGLLSIVNSARCSYGKWKDKIDEKDINLCHYLKKHKHFTPFAHGQICFQTTEELNLRHFDKKDIAGLEWCEDSSSDWVRTSKFLYDNYIEYFEKIKNKDVIYNEDWLLERENLYKASRLPYLQFRINAPIFVVRQLEKHQIGFIRNERSLRYTTFEPEFWEPKKWRKKSETNKQGSKQDEFIEEKKASAGLGWCDYIDLTKDWYDVNIQNGMCGEQARAILPLATYTEFVWTGGLQDFARLCFLRLKPEAQQETKEYAQAIYDLCKLEYPRTFDKIIKGVSFEQDAMFSKVK